MRTQHDDDTASGDADSAIARHRLALQEHFPLPDLPPLSEVIAHRARRRRKHTAIAALALACASAALLWADPAYRTDHLAAADGERSTALLADGSTLTLNAGARVQVAWHLRSRQVTLEQGQALFDVTHARWRPFTVAAADTRVTVVGTMFEVWRMPQSVRVTVLRGKVQVENTQAANTAAAAKAPVFLTPDQQIDSTAGGLSAVASVDAGARTAWKDGKLIFDRTPLAEALAELQRYTRVRIAAPDPQAAALQVSGVFDIARADAILDLLPGILPVTLTRNEQGDVVVHRHAGAPAQRK